MSLLDLDTTTNKYLEIINKNILEPYLARTNWEAIEDATYRITVDATFNSEDKTINSGTSVDDVLKTSQSGTETKDYFKINQESTAPKAAAITNTLNDSIDGATEDKSINPDNLANNFNADSDGLIYYTDTSGVKVYDLTKDTSFTIAVTNSVNPATLNNSNNNTYYDYFVRFKVLKYIKDNYVDIPPVSNLKDIIIAKLDAITITDLESQVTIDETALITKMLYFLEFINIKNNDKFEATVNCLYYYYYIALLEYNTIFCSKNLTYFAKTKIGIYDQLVKLKPTDSNYEYNEPSSSDLILSSLIAIFESLIGADNKSGGTFESSLITNIFITNNTESKVYDLIRKLLKLHYDASNTDDNKTIKLYQISEEDGVYTKTFTVTDTPAQLTSLEFTNTKHQLRLRFYNNEQSVNANIAGTNGEIGTKYNLQQPQVEAIESIPVGGNIDEFIEAYNDNVGSLSTSIFTYSNAIADIRELYDLLTELSSAGTDLYTQALVTDGNAIRITSKTGATLQDGDYDETKIRLLDANTKLAAIKPVLRNILEHYEKANKLNEIQESINAAYDNIESTTANDTIQDKNNEINKTLVNITKADNSYKKNVDKYKTKNNELNNILKNNLYNNIFLYITIVVLILICLGLIYINNHKASLKTQYSIMLIAFLLLYYIIYTNVTVNITETFQDIVLQQPKTEAEFKSLCASVYIYLYSLATNSKAYKESLEKEKKKYDGFAKSSNSKLNSLELVLNDEFINAIKSKELVKFLILFTAICIISYIVYTNTEDLTTTSIIFIILLIIILMVYFYNINLMTRTKADTKYWNYQMVMK